MRSVEGATASIHAKKSLLMPRGGRGSSLIDDSPLDVSGHAISKKTTEEADQPVTSKALKYMEKVKYLESEMERVRAGVKLLLRSVERLNEAVVFDSRWCGGLSDAISFVMGSCFDNVNVLRPAAKNEYSSVQMQSLDDSGHDSGDDDHDDRSDDHMHIRDLHSNSTAL